jgi:Family of unknown function (DUF6686)
MLLSIKVENMSPKNTHKRVLLNKNKSGQVEYCEACDVVEMEVGPVSIRLHAQDLEHFSALIQAAEMRLNYYNVEKARYETGVLKMEGVH